MNDAFREQLQYFPDYLGRHLLLTLVAISIGIAISLPLGLMAVRIPKIRGPLLGIAGVIQTIPGLAILAAMVVMFSMFGFTAALIALVLYSILPMLRNIVTGIEQVDASVVEAARGIGMTPNQILVRVQLPLAMPVIIAGIRTATVWTIGLATIATPVGATSLGNYIFSGLQTRNNAALILGCAGAAILAIVLDNLIGMIERAARRRSKRMGLFAATGLFLVLAVGLAPQATEWLGETDGQSNRIIIGAKGFTEQYILAEVIADRLRNAGYEVEVRQNLGSTVAFQALIDDQIACSIDYTGTIWANHMNREDNPGAEAVLAQMSAELNAKYGIETLGALGFENAYALAMRGDDARARGISTIDDLAVHASGLVMGSDYEFYSRPEWFALRDAYGLEFKDKKSFDPSLMYSAVAESEVDVISAFSTDGRIAAYDLAVLDDTRKALPPYDAVVLLSPNTAGDPEFVDALRPLLGAISDDAMREANKIVDVDRGTVREAADYLNEAVGNSLN
jgi:osmoprotectant transport system permease protein